MSLLSAPLNGWGLTGYSRDGLMSLPQHQSDKIMVDTLVEVQADIARLRQAEQDLTGELVARMTERKGTVIAVEGYQATLDVKEDWVCSLEVLAELQNYLRPEEWDRAAPLPPLPDRRPNKTILNGFKKRGGKVAEIIDRAYRKVPTGAPKVKVQRA